MISCLSTKCKRFTIADFRLYSTGWSHNRASFYYCTQREVYDFTELTIALWRYYLASIVAEVSQPKPYYRTVRAIFNSHSSLESLKYIYIYMLFASIPVVVVVVIFGLELAVAFVQADLFTVLLCIYLKDAIELHKILKTCPCKATGCLLFSCFLLF